MIEKVVYYETEKVEIDIEKACQLLHEWFNGHEIVRAIGYTKKSSWFPATIHVWLYRKPTEQEKIFLIPLKIYDFDVIANVWGFGKAVIKTYQQ